MSTWEELARRYLRVTGRRRLVVPVPIPGTGAIRAGGLLASARDAGGGEVAGRKTWEQFLAERA